MAAQGPNFPGTAANDATVGTINWVDVIGSDTLITCISADGGGMLHPTGVRISGAVTDTSAKLFIGGSASGTSQHLGTTFSTGVRTYGNSTELWGLTPTVAQINSSDFGFGLSLTGNGGTSKYLYVSNFGFTIPAGTINGITVEVDVENPTGAPRVDYIKVTITYTADATDLSINTSDTSTVGETITINTTPLVSVSDTATLSDSITSQGGNGIAVATDTSTLADSVTVTESISELNISVSDTCTANDFLPPGYPDAIFAVDTPTVAEFEVVDISVSVSDTTTANESVLTIGGGAVAEVTDVVTVGETITSKAGDAVANVTDTVTVGEAISFDISDLSIVVSDTSTLADEITSVGGAGVAIVSDTVNIGESIAFDISDLSIVVADTVTTGEEISFDISDLSIAVVDVVTVGEDLVFYLGGISIQITDVVTVGEEVTVLEPNLYIETSDTTTGLETVAFDISDLSIAIADTVTAGDVVSVVDPNLYIEIAETSTIAENIVFDISDLSIAVSDTSTLTDSISINAPEIGALSIWIVESFGKTRRRIIMVDGSLALGVNSFYHIGI